MLYVQDIYKRYIQSEENIYSFHFFYTWTFVVIPAILQKNKRTKQTTKSTVFNLRRNSWWEVAKTPIIHFKPSTAQLGRIVRKIHWWYALFWSHGCKDIWYVSEWTARHLSFASCCNVLERSSYCHGPSTVPTRQNANFIPWLSASMHLSPEI